MFAEQLKLGVGCPSCGSEQHHGCGFDPDAVRPSVSVPEALARTFEVMGYTPPPAGSTSGVLFWRREGHGR